MHLQTPHRGSGEQGENCCERLGYDTRILRRSNLTKLSTPWIRSTAGETSAPPSCGGTAAGSTPSPFSSSRQLMEKTIGNGVGSKRKLRQWSTSPQLDATPCEKQAMVPELNSCNGLDQPVCALDESPTKAVAMMPDGEGQNLVTTPRRSSRIRTSKKTPNGKPTSSARRPSLLPGSTTSSAKKKPTITDENREHDRALSTHSPQRKRNKNN